MVTSLMAINSGVLCKCSARSSGLLMYSCVRKLWNDDCGEARGLSDCRMEGVRVCRVRMSMKKRRRFFAKTIPFQFVC